MIAMKQQPDDEILENLDYRPSTVTTAEAFAFSVHQDSVQEVWSSRLHQTIIWWSGASN